MHYPASVFQCLHSVLASSIDHSGIRSVFILPPFMKKAGIVKVPASEFVFYASFIYIEAFLPCM